MKQETQPLATIAQISLELGVNKSLVHYYYVGGLLHPVSQIGKINLFDREGTIKAVKRIQQLKTEGKKLKEIKEII